MLGVKPQPFTDESLERDAHAAIALAEPRALIDRFATLVRESGSAAERASAEYIIERLRGLGVPVSVHDPELFLSVPERSELSVTSEGGVRLIASRPPSFSLSTGDAEVTGEVVYVPSKYAGGTGSLFDLPAAAESTGGADPVAGKIVLTEGFSMPGPVRAFEKRGAIAQIYVHPGPRIHEGICTTIWGAPTPESIERKPRTPVVCISRPDGERLASEATAGVRATVRTWLKEGWAPCLLPVVEIPGQEDPDEFLLVHGHYDSWYEGIGDNATGNAALLELARVLYGLRSRLKRSVRIAWWPGHSTGRYAGSTWYADTFADEIDQRCIAHLNIDSPGCAGATAYEEVMWMAEAGDLCARAIADAVGRPARGMRPLRAGDYSFNQIGPSAFYMLLSNIPEDERKRRGFYAVGGCGGNVAWHTPQDGLDVADLDVLRADLQVYLTTIVRAVNAPLYPFDYEATIAEIGVAVRRYHEAAGGVVNLEPILDDLELLRAEYVKWRSEADARVLGAPHEERRRLNATLRRLARHLVPLNYARGERFDHDPAIKFGPVPRLEAAMQVAGAPPDVRRLLVTSLVRERNKVRAILRAARRELSWHL
jgi:N-acetylated-alpha-linked acidic dipeptidase